MTELERARAHLLFCQAGLFGYRQWCGVEGGSAAVLQGYEQNVLAALSLVWEAQNREQGFQSMMMSETVAFRELYCQEWYLDGSDGEMRYERRGVGCDATA